MKCKLEFILEWLELNFSSFQLISKAGLHITACDLLITSPSYYCHDIFAPLVCYHVGDIYLNRDRAKYCKPLSSHPVGILCAIAGVRSKAAVLAVPPTYSCHIQLALHCVVTQQAWGLHGWSMSTSKATHAQLLPKCKPHLSRTLTYFLVLIKRSDKISW